eukprot:TRINITY_DN106686_c0_g1_i1.p1 TRINITY_DN106686_c0_g1~~TRINITY_DN106686_c0_g1_i1.p1  ORF type:complete len:396 (-),score=6.50 TRINITY_DN106686_c0_g1_i1:66-1157(-)
MKANVSKPTIMNRTAAPKVPTKTFKAVPIKKPSAGPSYPPTGLGKQIIPEAPADTNSVESLRKQVEELKKRNAGIGTENRNLLEENKRDKEKLKKAREKLEKLKKELSDKQQFLSFKFIKHRKLKLVEEAHEPEEVKEEDILPYSELMSAIRENLLARYSPVLSMPHDLLSYLLLQNEESSSPLNLGEMAQINPDAMSYEQLLELGERIGAVKRGLTPEQIKVQLIHSSIKKNNRAQKRFHTQRKVQKRNRHVQYARASQKKKNQQRPCCASIYTTRSALIRGWSQTKLVPSAKLMSLLKTTHDLVNLKPKYLLQGQALLYMITLASYQAKYSQNCRRIIMAQNLCTKIGKNKTLHKRYSNKA